MTGQPAFEIPTQHPAFKIPTNQDIKIWRYMDFAKYVAILQRRSLFFPRASLLGDPFEGSSTKPMVELREYIMKNRTIDPTLKEYEYLTDAYFSGDIYKNMVDQYLVSCWHMNEKAHPAVPGRSICSMKGALRWRSASGGRDLGWLGRDR
jgi:hypothetical protein